MKYCKILDKIPLETLSEQQVVDKEGNVVYMDFNAWVLQRLADPKFGKTMNGLVSVVQIKHALKKADKEANGYLELETTDWELLIEVVKEPSPSVQYNPEISWCLVPFCKAVVEATDNKPE